MNHVHKFIKKDIGRENPYIVFQCTLPGCMTYYRDKLILGKSTLCWSCDRETTVKIRNKKISKKPICDSCFDTRKIKRDGITTDFAKELLKKKGII